MVTRDARGLTLYAEENYQRYRLVSCGQEWPQGVSRGVLDFTRSVLATLTPMELLELVLTDERLKGAVMEALDKGRE